MNDRRYLMTLNYFAKQRAVAYVSDDKRRLRRNNISYPFREIINDDDISATLQKAIRHMASDIAGPARYQYRHASSSL